MCGVPFQCSSASRKFLNPIGTDRTNTTISGFSALQRAENSSMRHLRDFDYDTDAGFSALQRAENSSMRFVQAAIEALVGFSALQRAENSSIKKMLCWDTADDTGFQCSSASRKFLNKILTDTALTVLRFQCSSASRKFLNRECVWFSPHCKVSVLFSEPKIPQLV